MSSTETAAGGTESPPRTLGELTARAAEMCPDRPALLTPEGRWTFREVADRTLAAARALVGAGIRPGERIAILLPNGYPYFILYFAVPSAGGVSVPLSTFLAPPEIATVMEDCGAVLLVSTEKRLATLAPVLGRFAALRMVVVVPGEPGAGVELPSGIRSIRWEDLAGGGPARELPAPPDPREVAVLTYTSGTTGRMKGVMLSHANLLANADSCLAAVKLRRRDRLLLFLPMFHSLTQMVCLVTPRLACLPVILLPGVDRAAILAALRRFRPTIFVAVPAIYGAMAERRPGLLTRLLNPIRLYISGGSPLSADVLARFESAWRRPLCEGYGLSEASPVVSLNPVDGRRKAGSVGPPIPAVEIGIRADDGRAAATGEVGEILVRGPNVMLGYLGSPEETAAALRDGWLHTGDAGRLDGDGYLFIVGRKKEMLIFRGMNIYPREVEEVLAHHPDVAEAAVIGLEDADRGEVPHAAVALREGATADAARIRAYCRERLARYKVPRSVVILDALPKGPTGKVIKERVREVVLAARAGSYPSGE